jgi:endonuclease III-like uncharacterized protein
MTGFGSTIKPYHELNEIIGYRENEKSIKNNYGVGGPTADSALFYAILDY